MLFSTVCRSFFCPFLCSVQFLFTLQPSSQDKFCAMQFTSKSGWVFFPFHFVFSRAVFLVCRFVWRLLALFYLHCTCREAWIHWIFQITLARKRKTKKRLSLKSIRWLLDTFCIFTSFKFFICRPKWTENIVSRDGKSELSLVYAGVGVAVIRMLVKLTFSSAQPTNWAYSFFVFVRFITFTLQCASAHSRCLLSVQRAHFRQPSVTKYLIIVNNLHVDDKKRSTKETRQIFFPRQSHSLVLLMFCVCSRFSSLVYCVPSTTCELLFSCAWRLSLMDVSPKLFAIRWTI